MAGKTTALENEILDHILGTGSYTATAQAYVALFTTAPTDAGGGTEVLTSGGTLYTRMSVNFDVAASGATANGAEITFPTAGADWGTISAFGVCFADGEGVDDILYWGTISPSKVISSGDTAKFAAGAIDITED